MFTEKSIKGGRKHYHNEHYFSEPNLENCYFAGFIAADGCITTSKGSQMLVFGVKQSDKIILERFKSAIEFTGQIKDRQQTRKNTVCYRSDLWVCNVRTIATDLEKHFNITPRKTFTLQPPNITDPDLVKAFITGYIDGDGCINKKKTHDQAFVQIAGTYNMLNWIYDWFAVWYKSDRVYKLPNRHTPSSVYVLYATDIRAETILRELMSVSVPRLERKWDQYSYLS